MEKMSKDIMLITFKQLDMVSHIHYESHKKARKKAAKLFKSLDEDGDGWITKEEVMGSKIVSDLGKNFLKKAFKGVDGDGDGYITLDESRTLFYLSEYSKRKCQACDKPLLYGHAFSCTKCVQEKSDVVSLCFHCFESQEIQHPQHGYHHFTHDFIFLDKLLEMPLHILQPRSLMPSSFQTMKQCVICGDFHESNITGFMCDTHMCTMPNSNDYVCEWCFCYFCLKCGNPFRDDPTRAVPGKWLQRFQCLTCSQQQRLGDVHASIVKRYQKLLRTAAVTQDCKTCKTKQINGTMFRHANGNRMAIADTKHTNQLPELQDWPPPRQPPPKPSPRHPPPKPYSSDPPPKPYSPHPPPKPYSLDPPPKPYSSDPPPKSYSPHPPPKPYSPHPPPQPRAPYIGPSLGIQVQNPPHNLSTSISKSTKSSTTTTIITISQSNPPPQFPVQDCVNVIGFPAVSVIPTQKVPPLQPPLHSGNFIGYPAAPLIPTPEFGPLLNPRPLISALDIATNVVPNIFTNAAAAIDSLPVADILTAIVGAVCED